MSIDSAYLGLAAAEGDERNSRRIYSQSLAPSSVSANTTSEQDFAVTGLTTDDIVWVNKPTHQAGLAIVNVRVKSANTLSITFGNFTGSPIVPTTETYLIGAIRKYT